MIVLVGGTFNSEGGKESEIVNAMTRYMPYITGCLNGGTLEDLHSFVDTSLDRYTTLIWMPNIDNSEDKILPMLKKLHPTLILVQSKRCIEREYSDFDLVKRMLSSHSALCMKITKVKSDYKFSLMDPLGNLWCDEEGLYTFCDKLGERLADLQSYSRVRSECNGDREDFKIEEDFIAVVKSTGETFSTLMDSVNPERFLGNASTRCEHGFPSVREGNSIFVSKRNVDKTIMNSESFVEVFGCESATHGIVYLGDNKPSVDTPIQAELFSYYRNIKYMIHGHVYIEGAPYTVEVIPCGCLEEVSEIINIFPDPDAKKIAINLRGHGCIIMSDDLEGLKSQDFISRPFPEKVSISEEN